MKEREPTLDAIIKIPHGGPLHQFLLEAFAATRRSPTLEQIRDHFSLATIGEADAMGTGYREAALSHTGRTVAPPAEEAAHLLPQRPSG
mgnify:CR=1 FL=1